MSNSFWGCNVIFKLQCRTRGSKTFGFSYLLLLGPAPGFCLFVRYLLQIIMKCCELIPIPTLSSPASWHTSPAPYSPGNPPYICKSGYPVAFYDFYHYKQSAQSWWVHLDNSNCVSIRIFSGESRYCIHHGCQCAVHWRSNLVIYMVRDFCDMCSTMDDDVRHITSIQLRFFCYTWVTIL